MEVGGVEVGGRKGDGVEGSIRRMEDEEEGRKT